jgi:hypothetical protein
MTSLQTLFQSIRAYRKKEENESIWKTIEVDRKNEYRQSI